MIRCPGFFEAKMFQNAASGACKRLSFVLQYRQHDLQEDNALDNRELQEQIDQLNKAALQFANRYGKFFFYTDSSIYDLEQILQGYHENLRIEKPTENQLWSMASIWGAYLGETMLRNGLRDKGYAWDIVDGSSIPVLRNGTAVITPIDKVYKRFVNGREDSVLSFYTYMLKL